MLWLATRLHLFAMEGLEAVTALTHPKVMAAGVRQVGQELNLPADVKAWLKDLKAPEDQEALVWSLVAAFHQQKLGGGKKRGAGTLDWGLEEDDAGWAALRRSATGWQRQGQEALLHQPFQQALPPALQRHIHHYNTNLNLANVHLRRALDALDYLGRHPPSLYLRNPDAEADDHPIPATTEAPFPTPSGLQPVHLPPTIRHLPTLSARTLVLQHHSTQTTPTHFTTHRTQQTDIMIDPPTFHEEPRRQAGSLLRRGENPAGCHRQMPGPMTGPWPDCCNVNKTC